MPYQSSKSMHCIKCGKCTVIVHDSGSDEGLLVCIDILYLILIIVTWVVDSSTVLPRLQLGIFKKKTSSLKGWENLKPMDLIESMDSRISWSRSNPNL